MALTLVLLFSVLPALKRPKRLVNGKNSATNSRNFNMFVSLSLSVALNRLRSTKLRRKKTKKEKLRLVLLKRNLRRRRLA